MRKFILKLIFGLGLIFSSAWVLKHCDAPIKEEIATTLCVTNETNDTVDVFLTIGADTNYITSVKGIFGIQDTGMQGSFVLLPKATLFYKSPSGKGFSGNISFSTPPMNCPPNTTFPDGINIFEFALNNNFAGVQYPQETIDISCVSGVNCRIRWEIDSLRGWSAGNGIDSFKYFENSYLYDNVGRIGVYPIGCDSCSRIYEPPICDNPLKPSLPQPSNTCNIQRDANKKGGFVYVIYKGELKGIPATK